MGGPGTVSFTAWNMPSTGDRLEYAVTLDINPPERPVLSREPPLARAILSVELRRPPNSPDFIPLGKRPRRSHTDRPPELLIFSELATEFKLKLPDALTAVVD